MEGITQLIRITSIGLLLLYTFAVLNFIFITLLGLSLTESFILLLFIFTLVDIVFITLHLFFKYILY